jgi:ribonuclease BN (tRNA processing enzyme)
MSDDIHEVYAICYGNHSRKRSENYIFGDPHDEMTSIAYYVWVIKGAHGTFVVDTGFDEAAAKERGRKITHPVGEGLKALGVEPDKVEHVIATHMHWDHAGNYDLFPKARYHIQDTEMEYATGRCMCHQTPAPSSWRPALPCTRSAATPRGCNALRSRPGAAPSSSPPTVSIFIRTLTKAACSRSPIRLPARSRVTKRSRSSPHRATTSCRGTIRKC